MNDFGKLPNKTGTFGHYCTLLQPGEALFNQILQITPLEESNSTCHICSTQLSDTAATKYCAAAPAKNRRCKRGLQIGG